MIGAVLAMRAVRKGLDVVVARRDVDAFLSHLADDVVVQFPGHSPMSGRYVGKAAAERWVRRWFGAMDRIHFTVRRVAAGRPWAVGGTNTVMVQWDVEESFASDGLIVRAQGTTVVELRKGLVVSARDYLTDPDAYDAMWRRHEASLAAARP